MNKTILVTGGVGFIGNAFCKLILKERPEWNVINVDKCTYASNISTIQEELKNPHYKFIKEDITNREAIYKIFEENKIDMVVNFAAESHVDRSIINPEIFLSTNIIGTSIMMDACRKYGSIRFHQVSTDEVYGDLPLDSNNKFTEQSILNPSSPYSTSKASADLLVLAYYRTYGLPVTISRCSNNYGPYQFPEKLIPLMISKASNNESLPVYGDGLNVRDWLYVKDHCNAILKILEYGTIGKIYNIAGHNEKSNIELITHILNKLNKQVALITYINDRPGHDKKYSLDDTLIRTELGWFSETNFYDGLDLTISWYKENSQIWKL